MNVEIEIDEDEYEDRRDSLIQDAKESRAEAEAKQNEMLEAVAAGEEFEIEDYEWVSLGNVDLKVRTWLDGDTLEDFAALEEEMSRGDTPVAKRALEAEMNVLVTQTEVIEAGANRMETEADIREFWRRYVSKWGDKGLEQASEVIQEPLDLENEKEGEVAQSFPQPGKSRSDRARTHRR